MQHEQHTALRAVAACASALAACQSLAQGPACLNTFDFSSPAFYSTGPEAQSMSLGYLDLDHSIDLAVVNSDNGTVTTYLGNTDGTFTPEATIYTGQDATVVYIKDDPDPFTSGYGTVLIARDDGSAVYYTRDGSGYDTPFVCDVLDNSKITAFTSFDYIEDGNYDTIMTLDRDSEPDEIYLRVNLFPLPSDVCEYGFNAGSFECGDAPTDIVAGDFDGDGVHDLAVMTSGETTLDLFWGEGGGAGFVREAIPVGSSPTAACVADVNEDGFDDLVVALDGLDAVRILRSDGAGGFLGAINEPYTPISGGTPTDLALADFNHDGDLDIVLATTATPSLWFFPGQGNGAFGEPQVVDILRHHSVGAHDFDLDGSVDLASSAILPAGGSAVGVDIWTCQCTLCPADVNGDGMSGPADFTAWLACFSDPSSAPFCDNADVNNDGTLDPADYTAWLAEFTDADCS